VYPEYEKLPWKYQQRVSSEFWEDGSNQKKFVDWAATEFKIKEMNDWYRISLNVINKENIFNCVVGFCKYWRRRAYSALQQFSIFAAF
jgi:hypothetical protein